MSNCAHCGIFACWQGQLEKAPDHCPMPGREALYEETITEYQKDEVNNIARHAAIVEAAGYRLWTRLEEIIEFAWRAGFHKLGLAFCVGLHKEARQVAKILGDAGFQVESVACKTGGKPKELLGVMDMQKVRPGQFEAMCNPIAQAKILNEAKTDLNILLGLCVGHDTLFIRYTHAPVTVLAVKDRVLAHNPLGAIYAEYYYAEKIAAHQRPVLETPKGAEVTQRVLDAVQKAAPDGRISCAAVRELAAKLGVQPRVVGAACDELKVKVRGCELGCF